MSLRALGWNPFFAKALAPWAQQGYTAARVAIQHRGGYEVWTADGILAADVPGRFRHQTKCPSDYPAVGDWVAIEPVAERAIIHAVLPRQTKVSRTAPGEAVEEQVVVTNVDEIFILESIAAPPNLRRIERFLTLASESGAKPTVVLTKSDLATNVADYLQAVRAAATGVEVVAISAVQGDGLESIRQRLRTGRTVVLLGRSGVGKSTLINHLAGEETQYVLPVRAEDQKGRHATTSREMVFLRGGGVIIDTPGLRELQLWEGSEGLEATFTDIEELALRCRFTNCQHATEPGCAVRQATEEGVLAPTRLAAFLKLRAEMAEFTRRREARSRADERRRARNRRR
jgi:ribosome biogenesis GTPase